MVRKFDRSQPHASPWARFRGRSPYVQALVWAAVGVTVVGAVALIVLPSLGTQPVEQDGRLDQPTTSSSSTTTVPPDDGDDAAALLAALSVAEETPRSGFRRELFELGSSDADHDGCDTRHEVLIIESVTPTQVGPGCAVTGQWLSAYDGVTITSPSQLDLDHLVALAEAWDSGASTWEPGRRGEYANDLGYSGSLIAVSASSNRSKSDRDPAEWMPRRREAWCQFAVEWISVKVRWGLTADREEVEALGTALDTCTAGIPGAPPVAPVSTATTIISTTTATIATTTTTARTAAPSPAGSLSITALDCGAERVRVANPGSTEIDLGDWSLHDEGAKHSFMFPGGTTLPAGQAVTVASGPNPAGPGELSWTGSSVWNNDGDTAHLVDPGGTEVSLSPCTG
jgi:hypothetical protein